MAAYVGGMTINNAIVSGGQGVLAMYAPRWDTVNNEMMFAITLRETDLNMNGQVHTFIAIADVEPVVGQPAVPILNQMVSIVDGIIARLEAEATRIGFLK